MMCYDRGLTRCSTTQESLIKQIINKNKDTKGDGAFAWCREDRNHAIVRKYVVLLFIIFSLTLTFSKKHTKNDTILIYKIIDDEKSHENIIAAACKGFEKRFHQTICKNKM